MQLVDYLNTGLTSGRKLTLISAPAGFGKTTLVSEWITGCGKPVAWLSLDERDNDLARFLQYFVAAIQTINERVGKDVLVLLQSPQPPNTESILTTLLNEITTLGEDFLLVLDDYHLVDSKPVDEALVYLIDHQPKQMHLVITTREDPQLPLARYRARGQLTELRAADLRFSPAEAAEYLNRVMGLNLSEDDVSALETRTEGWIVGLQLAAISLKGKTDATGFIKNFTGSHHFVLDYLMEEVLHQQPEKIQNFLLLTSITDRLCGSLCDAILADGIGNGQDTLEYLERANLFIVPMDSERKWYRYHHLFGNLLRQRLGQKNTDVEISKLHIRASEWDEKNHMVFEAFQHASFAGDLGRAAGLAESAWQVMQDNFQSAAWLNWVKSLPRETTKIRPILSTQIAQAYMDAGKPEESEFLSSGCGTMFGIRGEDCGG